MEIFTVDDGMKWFVTATLDPTGFSESRVERIAECCDNHQVFRGHRHSFGFVFADLDEARGVRLGVPVDTQHSPESLVPLFQTSSRGKNPDGIALTHTTPGKVYRLRAVSFKDQTERTLF
jgi:hypothetical protein